MFGHIEKVVFGMAGIRLISSLIELSGALLMLYFGTAQKALQVNGALALVGPFVLVTVTAIGISGLTNDFSWTRIVWIVFGVGFILYGTRG